MRHYNVRVVAAIGIAVVLLIGACSTSIIVTSTFEGQNAAGASFSRLLVIGVAGNYDSRAQFERTLVAGLVNRGVSATAYYAVVPGNQPITRDVVSGIVESHGYDAVLLTRVSSQQSELSVTAGSSETKTTRKDGSALNLFRYDYEILNEPDTLNLTTTVVLSTELYSAGDNELIWAIELTSPGMDSVGHLIDGFASAIMDRLSKDRLIGHTQDS